MADLLEDKLIPASNLFEHKKYMFSDVKYIRASLICSP
jgi:hypothetical protein